MPYSDNENKQVAKDWYEQIKPKRVLDIGPGEGTYQILMNDSAAHWTAVEAWGTYVNQFNLKEKYDEVVVADVTYLDFDKLDHFDLIIIGDCIEHIAKDKAKLLILEMLKHTDHLLISFPVIHLDQEPWEGNYFEEHIGHWHYDEMAEFLGDSIVKTELGETLAYFLVKGDRQ
jgi:2-polyprenyl-3-methyl-5-hydroxy-6-metoxy-1,4-benzoquinol methylase